MTATASPQTADDFDIEQFLPYMLNRYVGRINVRYKQALRHHGLTLNHWRVLAALRAHGPSSVGEVARITVTDQPTASKLLMRMEEMGLIRRTANPADGRGVGVVLTDHGRDTFARLLPLARVRAQEFLDVFTAAELAEFQRLVSKGLRAIEDEYDGRS